LTTLADVHLHTCWGTPLEPCRTTNASTPIAATVSIVSRRLSPLLTLDSETANVITSPDSRFVAVSKLRRVRVDDSKNRLHTVVPRSAGTFGLARWLTSDMWSLSSIRRATSSSVRSSTDRRCFIRSSPRAR